MGAAASYAALAGRLLLFLVLPFALFFGLELVVPLSMLITGSIFFPFVAHPVRYEPGGWADAFFAKEPWSYLINGAFVVFVAVVTVVIGRRHTIWINLALFLALSIMASVTTHIVLGQLGFPYRVDTP